VTAAALLVLAPPATAASDTVPGDQPLPGYTVSNPPLTPLVVAGAQTTVHQGMHEHAAYILEVPADWNGELVMWAHGYRGPSPVLTVDAPGYGLRRTFLEQGYAWAASSYSANGYDAGAGVRSTADLVRHSRTLLGRPAGRVYLAGVSMGGHVIGRALEEDPGLYDGAMPMCGVLGDHELFDFFLSYNLVAQTLAGRDAYPVEADYLTADVPFIQQQLGLVGLRPGGPDTTNALGDQLRRVTIELSGGPRPGDVASFASWKDFLFTLPRPDDGSGLAFNSGVLSTNLDTAYTPNSPVDLNALVERVAPADPEARESKKLTAAPRILGRPLVPVLSLHDLGDMFVPFSMEQVYAERVAARGRSELLVQRAVRAAGHCEFSPVEAATAWGDLVEWVEATGAKARAEARPDGDDVLDPAVVAHPQYGCEFTDPAAYRTGSRPLFAPCA
jgi:hypothetical protein